MIHKRTDAIEVKDLDGLHRLFPYIMKQRTESEVCMHLSMDITDLMEWLAKENAENGTELKLFHAVCTAIGKTIYHRPLLNRFIAGRRFWQRKDISLSFVAKRVFADGAAESLICMKLKEEDDVRSISRFILGDVTKMREKGSNSMDDLLEKIGRLPRFLLEIVFWAVSRLEYHGLMPAALMEGDSNYTSVLLSNLGSIGGGAPYHHLNDYGTNSIMITIGTYEKKADAEGRERILLPLSIMLDERIADGFYFTRSLKYTEWLLTHPEELAKPIREKGEYEFH